MAHLVFAKPLIGINVLDFFVWEEKPGWANEFSPYRCEPFTAEMVPKALRSAKAGQDLGNLPKIGRVMDGLSVHRDVMDKIEALEPWVHQFFPLVLNDYDGAEVSRDYYLLNILQCIDAMDVERSSLDWAMEMVSDMPPRRESGPPPLFADKNLVSRHHLWRGNQVARGLMYFSENLMAALTDEEAHNLISFEIVEVGYLSSWRSDRRPWRTAP